MRIWNHYLKKICKDNACTVVYFTYRDGARIIEEWHNKIRQKNWMQILKVLNKNDMVGKIIGPLRQVTEKYFGNPIGLICRWSLTAYTIELENIDVEIKIVQY